jgi:hypothetical protein
VGRPASSSHPNDAARCLGEAFATSGDRDDGDGLAVDVKLAQGVASDIARRLHRSVDVVLRAPIQRARRDRAIVTYPNQDHAAVSVGERDRAVLQLLERGATLELHELTLPGERRVELVHAQHQRVRLPRLRVEQWICQSSRCAWHGPRTLA